MNISASEFYSRSKESNSLIIIDVREQLEFNTFNHGGTNIPLGTLLRDIEELEYDKNDDIIVVCQHGLRSETARRALIQRGYNKVLN
jgi:adenylyltransferase/sulfurtransferase